MADEPAKSREEGSLLGRLLGDFRVQRLLGRGGMGEVYLAEQVSLRRPVALKVLRPELVADADFLRRFESEAMAVAPIHHPNLVSVIAIGEADGIRFIAMEYVQGTNLRDHLRKRGRLEVGACANIVRKVASALQRAADDGIVHRDVKPENVLLTKKGQVKVADFGLARVLGQEHHGVTKTGMTLGTPLYMSPEQVQGKPADHRSDIYSLGVMAHTMLTGQPPFRGETAMAIAYQHVHSNAADLRAIRPDVPEDLARLIERMMAKSPEDRFQSAGEIVRELHRWRSREMGRFPSRPTVRSQADAPESLSTTKWSAWRWDRRFLVLAMAMATGCSIAAGMYVGFEERRQRLLPDAGDAAEISPPDISSVRRYSQASQQLLHAELAENDPERQRRLWAVLKYHPSDRQETIDAALELVRDDLGQRRYALAGLVAVQLIERDDPKQRMMGYLLQGICQSRLGKAKESNESFVEMFGIERPGDRWLALQSDQLAWLARNYFLSVENNSRVLGIKRPEDMAMNFWRAFPPNGARRPTPTRG